MPSVTSNTSLDLTPVVTELANIANKEAPQPTLTGVKNVYSYRVNSGPNYSGSLPTAAVAGKSSIRIVAAEEDKDVASYGVESIYLNGTTAEWEVNRTTSSSDSKYTIEFSFEVVVYY